MKERIGILQNIKPTCCLTRPHSISSNRMLSTKFHKPPTNFCPATLSTSLPCSLTARLVQIERPVQRISGHRSVNKGTSQESGSSWGSWVLNQCETHLYEKKTVSNCHTYRRLNLLLQIVTQTYSLRQHYFFNFWPVFSFCQCWLSQLTHHILHTNIGWGVGDGGQEDSKVSQ